MNTGVEVMSDIKSWSWKDIHSIYRIIGDQLQLHYAVSVRCGIPKSISIDFSDENNIFIIRFHQDVGRLGEQIDALDREILRRNSLIGVMG